jgi:hypothetical protein
MEMCVLYKYGSAKLLIYFRLRFILTGDTIGCPQVLRVADMVTSTVVYLTQPSLTSAMLPAADAGSVVKLTQTRDNHPKGRISPKSILTVFLLGQV